IGLRERTGELLQHHRRVVARALRQIGPGVVVLDDMGVGVDDGHWAPPGHGPFAILSCTCLASESEPSIPAKGRKNRASPLSMESCAGPGDLVQPANACRAGR